MPGVGFHQARHPRPTPAQRVVRALSWPNPGSIGVAVLGAALLFTGALNLGGEAPVSSTTPPPAQMPSAPSVSPNGSVAAGGATASPAALASSAPDRPAADSPMPTGSPAAKTPAPPVPSASPSLQVLGAAGDSPIQELTAAGSPSAPTKPLQDIANPASPLVVVNKHHPFEPLDYLPPDLVAPRVPTGSGEPALLRQEAAAALERMFADAGADGVAITVMSSFRSYATQVALYNSYVAQKGPAAADTSSARPGFSEHQTGFALDIGDASVPAWCEFTWCMASSPAGVWVAAHASRYGFVVRYQLGLEGITGYLAEPWHLRYVGIAVAEDMEVRGIQSYEQYLGLPGASDYK